MEGYYLTGTSYIRRCDISVSCHYTVNGLTDYSGDAAPGELSQLVYEDYYAWHATCWNRYSLGVEHDVPASGPTASIVDVLTNGQRFYRVRLLP